tara:strand:- start:1497 stop:1751 length:255 start_codon:yes stop_codon:yes gene_type:complete
MTYLLYSIFRNSATDEKRSFRGLNISPCASMTEVRAYNWEMNSFKWKGIPVTIPSSKKEWLLFVLLPLIFMIAANLAFLIFGSV